MPDYSERLKELKAAPCGDGEFLVICHHCTYPWKTTSVLELLSCPSCGGKTRRNKEEQK